MKRTRLVTNIKNETRCETKTKAIMQNTERRKKAGSSTQTNEKMLTERDRKEEEGEKYEKTHSLPSAKPLNIAFLKREQVPDSGTPCCVTTVSSNSTIAKISR